MVHRTISSLTQAMMQLTPNTMSMPVIRYTDLPLNPATRPNAQVARIDALKIPPKMVTFQRFDFRRISSRDK